MCSHSRGVSSKLTGEAAQKWAEYTQHKKDYQKRIEEIDTRLDTAEKTNADLSTLLSLRGRYKSELEAKPPFAVAGMVGDWLNEQHEEELRAKISQIDDLLIDNSSMPQPIGPLCLH